MWYAKILSWKLELCVLQILILQLISSREDSAENLRISEQILSLPTNFYLWTIVTTEDLRYYITTREP